MPPQELLPVAEVLTLAGFGRVVTYSRKVFIPLTQLCRDVCHYCTFAKAPRALPEPYLSADEVLAIARAGAAAGCKEALFTLGRQAGAALRGRARARWQRLGSPARWSTWRIAQRAVLKRDRTPAASEPRRHDALPTRAPAAGVACRWDSCWRGERTAVRAGRPALRLPRQAAGAAAGNPARAGELAVP